MDFQIDVINCNSELMLIVDELMLSLDELMLRVDQIIYTSA